MKAIQKIKSNLSKIINVLRHGILSLYSNIRKFIPWRSRTSTNSPNSSNSFGSSSSLSSSALSNSSISSYIRSLRNVRIAGMSASIMFGLLALAIIIPLYNVSGTEDTEAATSYNEASITLTAVRSSAVITADANTLGSSSFALISSNLTSSDTTQYAEYNVKTTNATGYTIGIATNTASTSTNLTSGSNTLSSLAYNTTTMNGISSSDYNNLNTTSYNNTWALYPGTVGNSANSRFYPISNNTITMGTTTAANSTVTSSNTYKVGLAARITMDQAAGTYTTTSNDNFKVTAVGNAAAYTISYNANGGDASTLPSPNPESSTSYSQQSVTLSSTTPTKTGYDFKGWCTKKTSDQTTQSNGSTACTNAGGIYYAKGGTFYIDETTKNITTLYAIWYLKDITVTGVFGGSGVTGITFANQTYGDKSITTNNGTTTLKYGVSYTITGTYSSGYEFSSWSATAGTLGSASSDSTTYSTTTAATLTLTGKSSCAPVGSLYCTIASMSKGKQTNDTNATTGIQAAITAPTSTDRSQDTSNSGVYEYDASLFGTSSDASNDYPIYYYRGILEPTSDQGSYGSDGKATTYPNYVKLSNNTCWRILRTTGSGGVKLIYNGTYGATTSGSCANAESNAQVITSAFNNSSASNGYTSLAYQNIHAVGYTYNNSVTSKTTATAASTVFGSNSNYSVNSSPSIMKQYLEQTWYKTNMGSIYTSKLEPSAGYCNDRSLYADGSYASALSESTKVVPYGTSSMTVYYFGPYTRNSNSAQKPSLTCPRNVVDLYTTSSASNGNKQLGYPVALATADEMSFAGSGNSTASNGSSYNAKSFAGSGSFFWLLSPNGRSSNGSAYGYDLHRGGYLDDYYRVSYAYGVRPVISLTSGTTPESGSGTATDPWVVTPPTLYDTIASMSKGKQTNNANATTGIQAAITAPTSTDRTQDTSNSGVYEYDASLFGASSDASNDYPIYYYRGILEPEADQGSYGSDGKATTYPNYVKLGNNTCWRILRTTGSGGVKLIYNGTYGATTSGSCANATTKAQVITSAFNSSSASNGYTSLGYNNIHAVGYTYNNSVTGSTSSTAASTVFGRNSYYSVNSSPSIMKQYLEQTWYKDNMTSYTSKLESSAGYCNDRSLYAVGSYTSALSESTKVVPYGTSSMTTYYFGAFARNSTSDQKPSLTCPRNVVDLYTASTASNGNRQLTYPVALATADEMSFAGSGRSTASQGSSYNAKSFAGSGSNFWLLSPNLRTSYGVASGSFLLSGSIFDGTNVYSTLGVRPVISLTSGTTPESGSGTATDPWVINP